MVAEPSSKPIGSEDLLPVIASAGQREHFRRISESGVFYSFDHSKHWRWENARRARATDRMLREGVPVPPIVRRSGRLLLTVDVGDRNVAEIHPKAPPLETVRLITALGLSVGAMKPWTLAGRRRTRRRFDGVIFPALSSSPEAGCAWRQLWDRMEGMPWFLSHGDLHCRNVVVDSDVGKLTLVDLQDVGPAPYVGDLALLSVDPNYERVLFSAELAAEAIHKFEWPSRQRNAVARRNVVEDIRLAQLAQLTRLVVVCGALARKVMDDRQFEREHQRSLAKLRTLAPESYSAVVRALELNSGHRWMSEFSTDSEG